MNDYPVIKFTIFFILGILAAPLLELNTLIYSIAVIFFLTLISLTVTKLKKYNFILSFFALALTLLLGAFRADIKNPPQLLPENLFKQKNFGVYGTITKIDLIKNYEVKFYLNADSIKIRRSVLTKKIKLIVRVRDQKNKLDSLYNLLYPGNPVFITGVYKKGRERRNPGEFDYNKYLRSNGISGLLTCYDTKDIKIINSERNFFKSIIFDIRKSIDESIKNLNRPESAALLRGLLLADRSEIDYQTKNEFINSGVIHVLAVSGLHTGFIAFILFFLLGRFNLYVRSILTILGIFAFMFLTGVPSSVFRASIMAVVIIIAFLTNRDTNVFNSIFLAALIILLFDPSEIFAPGFQLSFLAVLSIAAIYPLIQKEIENLKIKNKVIKYFVLFMGVSFSAQIGTLPVTLIYFGKLSLVALAANLIVIPAIGIIIGIAIFSLAVNIVFPWLASFYSAANDIIILILLKIIHIAGSLDFSYLPVKNFSAYDLIVFYALLILLLFFYKKFEKNFSMIVLILLCAANLVVLISLDNKELLERNKFNLMMIDVGQGDSFLIKFPNNETALIDAGDVSPYFDNGERIVMPLLNYLGIEKIDYGFISHMDADHFGGFVSLIHFNKIKKIFKPKIDSSDITDVKFEKYLKKNKIPFSYYSRKKIRIGNTNLYILNDLKDNFYNGLSKNNKSGVIKMDFGKISFLFTGDIEAKAENYYSKKYKSFLKSDVLKAAHHGSITSSTLKFINFVKPGISLISDGIQNKFGHPSSIVLNRLKSFKSKIYRTDKSGAILLRSNGDSIYVVDWRNF